MGLIRIITIAAILYLVYKAARYFADKGRFPVKGDKRKNQDNRGNKSNDDEKNEVMVACQYCDLRLPKKQAIEQDGKWFCSQAHLEADNDAQSH